MFKFPNRVLGFRFIVAQLLALLVVGAAVYAAVVRTILDRPFIYSAGVRHVYPEGHLRQVDIFKRLVPKGSVFYIMDQPEYGQAGLWRRSIYPNYPIILVYDPDFIHTPEYENLRKKWHISYVLCAGTPPPDPGLEWKTDLPAYPGSVPILVGKLRSADVPNQ